MVPRPPIIAIVLAFNVLNNSCGNHDGLAVGLSLAELSEKKNFMILFTDLLMNCQGHKLCEGIQTQDNCKTLLLSQATF